LIVIKKFEGNVRIQFFVFVVLTWVIGFLRIGDFIRVCDGLVR